MNSISKQLIAIFISCFFLFSSLAAQEMTWGEIPKEDLEMTVYEPYPEADAVVLGHEGTVTMDYTGHSIVTALVVHKRIKILKKSAFNKANISIKYKIGNDKRLSHVKAQIISPTGKRTKVRKNQIFDIKVEKGLNLKKIAFPNVQEGSIIEYRYELKDSYINQLPTWYFQEDLPVKWSRYRIKIPTWFQYIALTQGLPLQTSKIKTEHGFVYAYGKRRNAPILSKDYYITNVPPIQEEAFITTMDDYLTLIKFQLKHLYHPGKPDKDFFSTWEGLYKELINGAFGQAYLNSDKNSINKRFLDSTKPKKENTFNRLEKIYNNIQKTLTWDNTYSFFPYNIEKTIEEGLGNSANINMILLSTIRKAGFKAYPVLISTRNHGRYIKEYPIIDQFNHLIIQVTIDENTYLLDGSDIKYPIGFLPINTLNKEGWLLKDSSFQWIKILPKRTSKTFEGTINIDKQGTINGTINSRYTNYNAFDKNIAYKTKSEDVFQKEILANLLPNMKILNYQVKDDDENMTVFEYQANIFSKDYIEKNEDFLYINPMFHYAYTSSPFKQNKRNYPVETPFTFNESFQLDITIPDNYNIESIPTSITSTVNINDATFMYQTELKGSKIQFRMNIQVNTTYFPPDRYESLKQFYDLIVEKHGEQIVLKKKTSSSK